MAVQSGDRLSPAKLNPLGTIVVRKTLDEPRSSSPTIANDNTLFVPNLAVGGVYAVELQVLFRAAVAGATPGLKVDFSAPSGADITSFAFAISGTLGQTVAGAVGGITAATSNGILRITGLLVMGGSSGTLRFRWAQNTSSGSATTVASGSYLRLDQAL